MTRTRHLHPPHGAPRSGAAEAIRGHDARPGPPCPPGAPARRRAAECGQAAVLIVGALVAVLVGALVLGAVARGVNREGEAQRAADLAALAGARAMHAAYARRFEPAVLDRRANPSHVSKTDYLALGRAAAEATGRANGIKAPQVSFPDHTSFAPVRIQVRVRDRFTVGDGNARRGTTLDARAQAELAPPEADGLPSFATGGGYDGPLEYRQGKPMRPDVARAFDRLAAAARGDGVELVINSAFRSDAEQAELFRRHPDPKWVAPPGKSLHRYGTELDLGPSSAYGWLAGHARDFHFIQRYSWEAWHYGYTLNPRSTYRPPGGDGGQAGPSERHGSLPSFVPERFAPMLNRAAQRWNISATLLAAQLYAESNFNPFDISDAGAEGIAQFMPPTADAYGLENPFDPEQAIDAQGHLMRDLLREFGSVPLALAAYNAGPAPVRACACVPPYPETRAYVAKILGLMSGAGEPIAPGPGAGLVVRLVE